MLRTVRKFIPRLEEYDGWLLLSVFLLCLLGTVMVFGAASYRLQAPAGHWNHFYYLGKHVARLALGLLVMLLLANTDYRHLRRRYLNWGLVTGGLVFVALPVLLGGGRSVELNEYRRWFDFGLFPVQPLELAKVALVLFLAERLVHLTSGQDRYYRYLGLALLVPVFLVVFLVKQPNYGNALVVSLLTLAIIFTSGIALRLLASLLVPVTGAVVIGYLFVPKIASRVQAWWLGLQGEDYCYQVNQSLIGIGAGGWHGGGVGTSHQRFWFLPESHTDFIFAVIGEEMGLLGTLGTLALFVIFAWRGFAIARRARDPFGQVAATGLTTLIFLYVAANIAMVLGRFPVIGVPLPFVSYGGSALVTNLAAVGILLSIDRYGRAHQAWRARLTRV